MGWVVSSLALGSGALYSDNGHTDQVAQVSLSCCNQVDYDILC